LGLIFAGTPLAIVAPMAKRRADQAPLGLTSNGILLVNVLGLLDEKELGSLRKALPRELGRDWFIGAAVAPSEATKLMARIDDAAAEGAARFSAHQRARPTAARAKRRR